jgi:hypothetical protein
MIVFVAWPVFRAVFKCNPDKQFQASAIAMDWRQIEQHSFCLARAVHRRILNSEERQNDPKPRENLLAAQARLTVRQRLE